MKEEPLISIIVPVYKSEKFLGQCIDSLIDQTLRPIEIILINDGSPDTSGKICDEYGKLNHNILIIHQENKGAAAALNAGTKAASAPFIMYLDADDWIEKDTCQISYEAINSSKSDVVFWSYFRECDNISIKDKPIFEKDTFFDETSIKNLHRRIVGLVGKEMKNPVRTDAISAGWGKLYRRNIIIENNIKWIDTQLVGSSDVIFSIQVFQHVQRALFLNKHLNHYRMYNPNSLTKNYSFSLYGKLINLYSIIFKHLNDYNLDINFHEALSNRISLSLINSTLSIISLKKKATLLVKYKHLRLILNDNHYKNAIKSLKLIFLPLHWKLFFLFAKWRFTLGIYFLGIIMSKLRK